MIDWIASLPPTPRLIVGGLGLLLAYLVLVEVGGVAVVGGLVAFAYLTTSLDWTHVPAAFAATLAALVVYVVLSVVKPNAPCWWCAGQPRRGMTSRGRWRGCLVCGGSGKRRALGSKILRRNRRFLGLGSD